MQVTGQNIKQTNNYQQPVVPQPNVSLGCSCCCTNPQPSVSVQSNTQSCCTQTSSSPSAPPNNPPYYIPPQNTVYPSYTPTSGAGVNIQIINPAVMTPGASPVYNVNAPSYPSNYYTGTVGPDGKLITGAEASSSGAGVSGSQNGQNGSASGVQNGSNVAQNGADNNSTGSTSAAGAATSSSSSSSSAQAEKKTEKRKIVELTDSYIQNLETYLNSQDKAVRLNAAKEVYARLKEDESRCDDKALNALINKMLQDPSQEIRFIALSALDERIVTGDDYTVNVLKQIQANSTDSLGLEAADANSILLKMSARTVEKEFEVKDDQKKKSNSMSDKFKPEGTKL